MENRLDKFIKKKLGQRSFDYSDSHWKEMEHLLDVSTPAASKRRNGLWLLLLLFLIAGSFTIYQLSHADNSGLVGETALSNLADNDNTNLNESTPSINSLENTQTIQESRTSEINNSAAKFNYTNNPTATETPNQESSSNMVSSKEKLTEYTRSVDKRNAKENIAHVESNSVIKNLPADKRSQLNKAEIFNQNSVSEKDSDLSMSNENINEREFGVLEMNQSLQSNKNLVIGKQFQFISELNLIEAGIFANKDFSIPNIIVNDLSQPFGAKVVRRSPISIGFQVGSNSNTELYGLNAGLVLRLDLNPLWTLKSGVRYGIMTGISPVTKRKPVVEYGFRASSQDAYLKANAFHFIEMPISLNYKLFKHNFGIEAQIKYLVGVRGDIAKINMDTGYQSIRKNWIVTDGFNRFIPTVGLIYGYDFNKRWSLNMNLSYSPQGLNDTKYEVENEIDLGIKSRIWTGISLHYLITR